MLDILPTENWPPLAELPSSIVWFWEPDGGQCHWYDGDGGAYACGRKQTDVASELDVEAVDRHTLRGRLCTSCTFLAKQFSGSAETLKKPSTTVGVSSQQAHTVSVGELAQQVVSLKRDLTKANIASEQLFLSGQEKDKQLAAANVKLREQEVELAKLRKLLGKIYPFGL